MTATPWAVRRPALLLGEHNAEVFGKPVYSHDELVTLRQNVTI
jgi:crotonobetainyl-CoA:carnitine CoA-transferase CaiB-like acyl-CoA transferase